MVAGQGRMQGWACVALLEMSRGVAEDCMKHIFERGRKELYKGRMVSPSQGAS